MEDIDVQEHSECTMRMRWYVQPSKTNHSGGHSFENTFLVDPDTTAILAGLPITKMLHNRVFKEYWPLTDLSLFMDPDT